jgi:sucrose-6-phosphate hydrolase SacC (GH32 family)
VAKETGYAVRRRARKRWTSTPDEDLALRAFLDKNMIGVFANDRQAAAAPYKYAPENLGVSLFSKGGDAVVKEVKGWKMKSICQGP